MLITISGTHFSGKTTLIHDFIKAHPEYGMLQEPYFKMADESASQAFLAPNLEDFVELLDTSIEQLSENIHQDNLIFDRCPVDLIAYAMCHAEEEDVDLNTHEISERFEEIITLLQHIDMMIFLPLDPHSPIVYPGNDQQYRLAADRNFNKIFNEDAFHLLPNYNNPKIRDLSGGSSERLEKLEQLILE